jgi:hypothetical protein
MFGLYLSAQKVTGVTAGWGVYQEGATDKNYFAGNCGIGTSDAAFPLHIASSSVAGICINADGAGLDDTMLATLYITRSAAGHLGSHIAMGRYGVTSIGLGLKQTSNIFGFGPTTTGAFSPSWLAIDPATGHLGIGVVAPTSPLQVILPLHSSDTDAGSGGLTTGALWVDASGFVRMKS